MLSFANAVHNEWRIVIKSCEYEESKNEALENQKIIENNIKEFKDFHEDLKVCIDNVKALQHDVMSQEN